VVEPEIEELVSLYRTLLKDWTKQNAALDRAWARAKEILAPGEVRETGKLLEELDRRAKNSKRDLGRMVAENVSVREVLRRNLSALERGIEAMQRLTAEIERHVQQTPSNVTKRKGHGVRRRAKRKRD
jgi:hypothetical protein